MPTHTTNFGPEQYSYISSTTDESESFSERARELINLGMALEQTELDRVAEIQQEKHPEWSPDVEGGLTELVDFYIENHENGGDN